MENSSVIVEDTSGENIAPVVEEKALAVLSIDPAALRQAKESLSIITTILLSPGADSGFKAGMTFYAHLLMRLNQVWTLKVGGRDLPTAAVSITDKINLYINPYYWNSLDTIAKIDLIEHELEHLIYMHPIRAKDYISVDKNAAGRMKCANIAMDANINENKKASANKHGWVTVENLNKQLTQIGSRFQLDLADPWEVHYEKLMQASKENPDQSGDGTGGFGDPTDDHGVWSESTESKEVAEGIIRDAANKAQQATGIGNMPSEMLREIANMNKSSVRWERQMHQFVCQATQFDFTKTRNRRNRRYGVVQPGRKKKPKLHICVINDESGSVSDNSFAQYGAELAEIHKLDIEITVIAADAQVHAVYKFDPKKPWVRSCQGGTMYQPGITHAMELGADVIFYFGDMDAADVPTDPGVPFLWCVVGQQNPPASFGKVIRITETQK